jgi:tRNA G10  N-methylase Trm11
MATYLLQLGHEHELCWYEIRSLAALQPFQVGRSWHNLVEIVSLLPDNSITLFLEQLGGTIRAIQPVAEWSPAWGNAPLEDLLPDCLVPQGPWAVSALSPDLTQEREAVRTWIRHTIETNPLAHGREERVAPGQIEQAPTRVHQTGLLEKGIEICLWRNQEGKVWLGKTLWVFSSGDYAERDMGKPNRPQRRGLLPPKLARQMINLARKADTHLILDPFCGSGVLLLEGMELGLTVMGSDYREEALVQSRENLHWYLHGRGDLAVHKVVGVQAQGQALPLQKIDVRTLSSHVTPLSVDAVVGEGDLGPPIHGHLGRKKAIEIAGSLNPLYVKAFAEIRIVLRPGGRVCLAVPFWQPTEGEPVFLNLKRLLPLIGYQPTFPEKGFAPILYRRPDQRVGRAIYVLESPL